MKPNPRNWLKPIVLVLVLFVVHAAHAAEDEKEAKGGPVVFKYLKYRPIGPAAGGRVSRSCGVPGDPLIYYAATSAGGVWKSTDGGINWKPIFDEQPIASIGSIAVSPADPNVIYVGSGEANIRGNVAPGNGIYKSVDAGKTWKQVWKQEGQIGTMIVHPTNPDIALAAVLGHAFGANPERGVYRTTDGGKTWQKVLFKDADTGASDVCFDASNPKILFAGLWQTRRKPWELTSGGPGSGLYTSRDGGDTWQHLTEKGLPEGVLGKICVAVAPSDSRRVYAIIEADKGGLFRSDDGGETWKNISSHRALRQRAWYFSTITVDPKDPNVVWCPQVPLLKSIDGGKTFARVKGPHHGDHHDIWIDPQNPKRIIDSNDGGVDVSNNGGETWYGPPLPIAQFYHVAVDNRTPYYVSGCMQDVGAASGPSNSLSSRGISLSDWQSIGGGEAGFTAPDPSDPNIVYAGEYGGYISRYDQRTRQARNITVYPFNASGHGAEDLRYRFQWTAPILVSPHDGQTVYHGGNVLFKTTDAGLHWSAISPDLTRNDKSKQKWSGGPITGDNTGVEVYGTIFAIAESPKQKDLLWTGSDDGLVHVSRDGGKNWANVTKNIAGLPEWGTVACIEPSPFEAGTAYVVVDAHRLDDMHPYLFKTTDFGASWKSLSAKLPPDIHLHVVREDPGRKSLLFVGTEHGVSFSTDNGATWTELKLNLPTVAVHDMYVKNNDLVVATHGRSIWIFDDLTPIRSMAAAVAEKPFHLFPMQPAMRYRYHGSFEEGPRRGGGENPPKGAMIAYFLKEKPKKDVTVDILDSQDKIVDTLSSKEEKEEAASLGEYSDDKDKKPVLSTKPGVHRVVWDLHYKGADTIKGAKVDAGELKRGPMVLPGSYTIKLTLDDKTVSCPLVVQPDPRQKMPEPELAEQLKFALALRDDISRLSRTVNQLRSIRQQLQSHNKLLKDNAKAEPLIKTAKELITKLDDLEAEMHNPKAQVTYDILAQRGGAKLYSQLGALLEWVKEADGAPTQGMREVYQENVRALNDHEKRFNSLVSTDLAKINETARKLDIPSVIVPAEKPSAAATRVGK